MADLVQTAASVVWVSGPIESSFNAGETIVAGDWCYLKSSTSKWMKAQADGTTEEAGQDVNTGYAMHDSINNRKLSVQTGGVINPGATVVVGVPYVISAAAGKTAPFADLVSTNKVSFIGFGLTAATLDLSLKKYTGVVIP